MQPEISVGYLIIPNAVYVFVAAHVRHTTDVRYADMSFIATNPEPRDNSISCVEMNIRAKY